MTVQNTVRSLEVFYRASAELTPREMLQGTASARKAMIEMRAGKAVTEVVFFGGRRGSGKTYAAGKFVEELLSAGMQVVILDVVGNWWGLRATSVTLDTGGADNGFKIPVIGGSRGDIPLLAEGGAAVAQMLVDTGSSAVLDVSELRKGARQRFITDWAEEFFHLKKSNPSAVHVVIEEAHTVIPQRAMKGQERMLGALEDLVRLGRNYGIGASLIDQRPQSVHKDVLNQAEVMCAFQFTGAQERDAIKRWAEAKELDAPEWKRQPFNELASLQRGQCILWSPVWLKFCGKVDVAPKVTFDASATPDGAPPQSAMLKQVDLPALEAAMRRAAEGGKRSDKAPAVKARVERDTQNEALDAAHEMTLRSENATLATEVKALRETERTLRIELDTLRGDLAIVRDKWARALSELGNLSTTCDELAKIFQIGDLQVLGSTETVGAPHNVRGVWRPDRDLHRLDTKKVMAAPKEPASPSQPTGGVFQGDGIGDQSLSPAARDILIVLSQRGPQTRHHALVWADRSRSGATDKAFADLFARSLVTAESSVLSITDDGREALGEHRLLPNPPIGPRERLFLSAIAQFGPVSQAMVLLRTGYARSGTTDGSFALLRRNDWVTGDAGGMTITDFGKKVLGAYQRFPTGTGYYQNLVDGNDYMKLSGVERDLLQTAWEFGATASQKDLLAAAERARSGSTDQAFSRLVKLGLLERDKSGHLKTAAFLRD